MKEHACAVSGSGPIALDIGRKPDCPKLARLKSVMKAQIEALMERGVTTFLTGMSQGADRWGAEVVLELKKTNPQLRLIAVLENDILPPEWSVAERQQYHRLLAACHRTVKIDCEESLERRILRDQYMIDHADYLLAVFTTNFDRGETVYIVEYARKRNCSVLWINPDKFTSKAINPIRAHKK